MVGLKIVDTLVQEGGVLASSWRWPLIAGLCGGVYASVVNAHRLGIKSERPRQMADASTMLSRSLMVECGCNFRFRGLVSFSPLHPNELLRPVLYGKSNPQLRYESSAF